MESQETHRHDAARTMDISNGEQGAAKHIGKETKMGSGRGQGKIHQAEVGSSGASDIKGSSFEADAKCSQCAKGCLYKNIRPGARPEIAAISNDISVDKVLQHGPMDELERSRDERERIYQ
jgi:hypothetical protein